jgi:hypothetical protein
MAIIVEDGTGVDNANSYVSVADYKAYAAERGTVITVSDAVLEQYIVLSMDYLETFDFIGLKLNRDQALQWPRYNVIIDGYAIETNSIPKELKAGLNEIITSFNSNIDPQANVERLQEEVSVGPISVKYSEGGSSQTIVPKINTSLKKLIRGGGAGSSGIAFPVKRG